MSDVVIRVEHLGKRYNLGGGSRATLMKEAFSDGVGRLLARTRRDPVPVSESSVFWALRDISFEVKRGEVVGIFGHNGAGKSVLLKILSRITKPTCGTGMIDGRVGSLLEIGTGFHPELSGRENVHLNGTILGMRPAEIRERFDDIVAFSGVEKFIDTPVKHYSSGMNLRLAFSVAAFLDADVILLDEVWAAGDADFQVRSLAKMRELIGNGRTVILVSHSLDQLRSLCSRAILLDHGRILAQGETGRVIEHYESLDARIDAIPVEPGVGAMPVVDPGRRVWLDGAAAPGTNAVRLREVVALNGAGLVAHVFGPGESPRVGITLDVLEDDTPLLLGVAFAAQDGRGELMLSDIGGPTGSADGCRRLSRGSYETFPPVAVQQWLPPGTYRVSVYVGTPATIFSRPHIAAENLLELKIAGDAIELVSSSTLEHPAVAWRQIDEESLRARLS